LRTSPQSPGKLHCRFGTYAPYALTKNAFSLSDHKKLKEAWGWNPVQQHVSWINHHSESYCLEIHRLQIEHFVVLIMGVIIFCTITCKQEIACKYREHFFLIYSTLPDYHVPLAHYR
jgi:hypothetical protein